MDVLYVTAGRNERRHPRRPMCGLALVGLLGLGLTGALPSHAQAGISLADQGRVGVTLPTIDEHDVVTLWGNTPRGADPGWVIGGVSAETELRRLVLVLKADPAREHALQRLVQQQQEPGSEAFHRWLTPEDFGERFGATQAELDKVTSWLHGHGFTVEQGNAGRRVVVFSGSEGAVEDAFHVALRLYVVDGETHIANGEDPQIPRALAGVVGGVLSLNDFRHRSQIAQQRPVSLPGMGGDAGRVPRLHPLYTQGTTHYLFPADFATIYDANPLYAQGINGVGASIAVVGRSDVEQADFSEFRSFGNLPSGPTVAVTVDGPDPGLVAVDQDEATLDIEWAGAVAPEAQMQYVEAASTATTDGVDLAAAYVVNHRMAQVMSVSYASCESSMGAAELEFYNDLWMQAASEGISVFVSAGDAGAAGCSAGGDSVGSGRAVNGMCSSIWSTCVGGTEFNEGNYTYWNPYNGPGSESALGHIPEVVWNESGTNGGSQMWASGGGVSAVYRQPLWQAGIAGANGNGMRTVPDVALSTALHDGYLGCVRGSWYVFSGTSVSSPAFAGLMALVNQKQNGTAQGSANPELYAMVNAPATPFHTTLRGNNSVPGVSGFSASGTVYNLATGLGSVDAEVLVENWAFNAEGIAESFTLTPSETTATVVDGSRTTFTIAATTTGSTGAIVLTATAPAGVTVSFQPTLISPGQSTTMTVAAAANAPTGSGTISVTGTSGQAQQTVKVGLTVDPAPALSLIAAPAGLTVTQGANASTVVTVATGGTFNGQVMLMTTGLPPGVTAVWSTATVTPPADTAATTVTTLTLVAAANAPSVTGAAVTLTATGDGLTTTATVTVTVVPAATGLAIASATQALTLVAGGALTVPVTVTASNGLVGLVRVGVAGLPAGVTAFWSAAQFEATAPETEHLTLTLRALATAVPASGTALSLVAFGDGQTAYGGASLTVALPTVVELSLATNPLSLTPGATATTTATVRILGPLTLAANLAGVELRMTGLPVGVTVAWGAVTDAGGGVLTAPVTVRAAATAATGTVRVLALGEVTDASTGAIYDAVEPVEVVLHPAATLTVASGVKSLLLVPGATARVAITVTASTALAEPVRLTVLDLPAGVTAAWSKNPVVGTGGTVTLTLTVAASVRPTAGSVSIEAMGDGLAAQTAVEYRVY